MEHLEDRTLLTAPASTVDGLITAINAANDSGQPTTITLAPVNFYPTAANNKTDGANNAFPAITGNIMIQSSEFSEIYAKGDFRFFDVAKGASLTLISTSLVGSARR